MPMTTHATHARTPRSKRKNNFMPDIEDGLGSSTWSLGDSKKAEDGWMLALSPSSLPSGASNSYILMAMMSWASESSPIIHE